MPHGPPDDRFLFLSDVLPTAWQAVEYADIPDGGTLLVLGAGPDRRHGRPDRHAPRPAVIVADLVPERLQRVRGRGAEAIDITELDGPRWATSCATGPPAAAPTR